MPDQLKDLAEKIQANDSEQLLKWRRHSGLDDTTRELYRNYERARSAAHGAANTARMRVERLRDDDTMAREGRARLIREAIAEGQKATRKAWQVMETTLTVLDAHLAVVAQPRIDEKREMLARDEIRTRLNGSTNIVAELLDLAQRDSDMAGVLANGTWAESFLRGQGTDLRVTAQTVATLHNVAANAATQSADPVRRAAAEARAQMSDLHDSLISTSYTTRTALEAAGEAAMSAGVNVAGD